MASVFPRRGTIKLYANIKDINGVWKQVPTGFDQGKEAEAQAWADAMERGIERERARHAKYDAPITVALYAGRWLDRRKTKTVNDDRTRIEKHVLPRIGHLLMVDVRPHHLRDLIVELKNEGAIAPKTIREVSGILHTMFNSAVVEELIPSNPVVYERGVLPKKMDKDPNWRHQAIYTRPEIEQLISDERIPEDRRVLYALKFFTGRHTEVALSTWERYDAQTQPLGTLQLVDTKSGIPRAVPVHATLAKILARWKLGGWQRTYGRAPRADDLIVRTRRGGKRYTANAAQKQLLIDLELIGLRVKASTRNRRGHDLRRTLITLARSDGAIDSLLRWITHGPKPNEILDVYSSPPWEALCTEMAKLKITLREGQVIRMAANDPNGILGAVMVQPSQVAAAAEKKVRPRRDSNPSRCSNSTGPDESKRELAPVRLVPSGEDLHQTAPRTIQTTCDIGLEMMLRKQP
jgi:hypothetical protein